MPPLSRVPGRARGEVWTEITAMLHMRPSMIVQASIVQASTPSNGASVHWAVRGPRVVLRGLRAAKEVEPALALLDGLAQGQRLGEKPHREVGIVGIIAAVVEEGLIAGAETEHGGHADPAKGEEEKLYLRLGGQSSDDDAEEALHLLGHEGDFIGPTLPVQAQEVIQRGLHVGGGGEGPQACGPPGGATTSI